MSLMRLIAVVLFLACAAVAQGWLKVGNWHVLAALGLAALTLAGSVADRNLWGPSRPPV